MPSSVSNRLPGAAAILAVVMILVGCITTDLQFNFGAPYKSPYTIEDAVIVSFPDDLNERIYRINVGEFLDRRKFAINVLEAYASEVVPRMHGIFTEGVTLTTESTLVQVLGETPAPTEESPAIDPIDGETTREDEPVQESGEPRELGAILDDLAAVERKEETAPERTQEELTEEAIQAASLEQARQRGAGHILRFDDALLAMIDDRIAISFSVTFEERDTRRILHQGRYSGRSRRYEPGTNMKTNEDKLKVLVKEAFVGPMRNMVQDMALGAGVARE